MMKKFLFLVAAVAICCTTSVKAQTFSVGESLVEANVGLGSPISFGVSYEKGMWQVANDWTIGVGGVLDFIPYTYETAFEIQAMGLIHWTAISNFDFYTGLQLGYEHYITGGLGVDFSLGARYYFNDTWAVTANINRGFALGVTMKL